MSVGELFDGTIETAASLTTERHLVFDWELVGTAWTAGRGRVGRRDDARRPSATTAGRPSVFSNHDQPRHASRLAASVGARRSRTRSPGRPRSCC